MTSLPLLDLLQIADRSFPTGGFVHSHGLEWLVKNTPIGVEQAVIMRLRQQLARFELVFLAHTYLTDWRLLDERFHAMVLPREAREASIQVGRQLLRAVADMYDSMDLHDAVQHLPYAHHPVAFGIVGQTIGLDAETTATAYAYQTVRAQVSAAQRLTRLGQTEAQRIVHRLKPEVRSAGSTALRLSLDEAGAFVPVLDVASMAHERAEVRLFVS